MPKKASQIVLPASDKYALVGGLIGIIDSAMDAIITINEAQRVLFFNPAAEQMFGCKASEVLGSRVDRFIPERFRKAHKEHIRKFGETGVTSRRMGQLGEIRGLRTNGEEFPIEASISQVSVGGTKLFSVILRDVTERKQLETAIATSEQKFRAIYEQAPLGICLHCSHSGRFLQANQKYCEFIGRTQEELLNIDFQTITHPDDLQADLDNMKLLREGKIPSFSMEKRYIRPDGSIIWGALTVVPMWQGESGNIHLAMVMDITERKQADDVLRESEDKFRMLAENANAIIGVVQGDRFVYVNPYLEVLSGYSRDELLQMSIAQLIHPDYRAEMLERARRRQAGESFESHYEFAMLTKSQEKKILDFSVSRIHYRGQPGLVGIAIDITERKRTEEALRESEEKFRVLAESARAIVAIIEGERFVYVNPYFEEISGYTSDELLQMQIGELVHPDFRAEVLERARRRQAGEDVESHYEFAVLTKSQERRMLDFTGTKINYRGKPAIVAIAIDITEHERMVEALRESEDKFRVLAESARAFIGVIQSGRFVYVNPYVVLKSGYSRDELLQMPIGELVHPDFRAEVLERARKRQAGEEVEPHYEFAVLTKSQEKRLVDFSASRINYRGQPAVLGIAFDITDRKQAEEQLHNMADELARSNRDLEQFAYMASHDLQEPLRNIRGFITLLRDRYQDMLDTKARDFIVIIYDGATWMEKMIDALLEYSRLGRGKLEMNMVDCNTIVAAVIANLRVAIQESSAKISFDTLPTIKAEPLQITQLFQNLIANAIKYRSDKPPKVHISATSTKEGWQFSVSDNGIGIDPSQFERIFMIFQRLHARDKYSGVGIGLSVCKKIVELHGGRIWLESELGKGTTFFFTIPFRNE